MTLAAIAKYAQDSFIKTHPDDNLRDEIIVTFITEELGITDEKAARLVETGEITIPFFELHEDMSTRFFLWLYVNHLSAPKYGQPMN